MLHREKERASGWERGDGHREREIEGRGRGREREGNREWERKRVLQNCLMHYIDFYFELKTMRSQSNLSNGWINSLCSSPQRPLRWVCGPSGWHCPRVGLCGCSAMWGVSLLPPSGGTREVRPRRPGGKSPWGMCAVPLTGQFNVHFMSAMEI